MSWYSILGWEQILILWVIPDESLTNEIFSHFNRYCHFSAQESSYSLYFSYEFLSQPHCLLVSNCPYQTWSHLSDTENRKCLGVYIAAILKDWLKQESPTPFKLHQLFGIIYFPELPEADPRLGSALLSFFPSFSCFPTVLLVSLGLLLNRSETQYPHLRLCLFRTHLTLI